MDARQEVMAAYAEGCRARRDRPEARRGLLVGQAAPKPVAGARHIPLFPFPRNCAGERLHRMSGLELTARMVHWDTVNTIAWFPGRATSGKGDAFPARLAREQAAERLVEFRMPERVCLFVGRLNATAYQWAGRMPSAMEWQEQDGGGRWAWFPHTSGIVAFWNSEENRRRLADLFAEAQRIILSGPP